MRNQVNRGGASCQHQAGNFIHVHPGCMPATFSHAYTLPDADAKRSGAGDIGRSVGQTDGDDLNDLSGKRDYCLLTQPVGFQTAHFTLSISVANPQQLCFSPVTRIKDVFLSEIQVRTAERWNAATGLEWLA